MTDGIRTVLDNTSPLNHPRGERLPLFIWPASDPGTADPAGIRDILRRLDARGIPLVSRWRTRDSDISLENALRVGRLQQDDGLMVCANANDLLHRFYDGSPDTAHVDADGNPFFDYSFSPDVAIGCPFAVEHRIPAIRERVTRFADAYVAQGVTLDFAWADWEIDGPIEWNGAWEASRACTRCRERIPDIDDFEAFQAAIRSVRAKLQREAYAGPLRDRFPDILVGNYAVYRHGGERYWYDYFEPIPNAGPYRLDHRARVRPWAHEFDDTGYTFGMPVLYTWYRTFGWYDFPDPDFRWFYNMLQVATNAGRHAGDRPLISFCHYHTTAPPDAPDPDVVQMSEAAYRDLLWHALLRGHDTLFTWCRPHEVALETRLAHAVYAESLEHADLLAAGEPIAFDLPAGPDDPVVSAVRSGDTLLARCSRAPGSLTVDGRTLELEPSPQTRIIHLSD